MAEAEKPARQYIKQRNRNVMEDHIHLVTIFRHTVLLYSNFNIASQCNLRKIFIIRIIDSTNYFLNISRIRSSRVSSGRTPVVYPQIFSISVHHKRRYDLNAYILCNLFRYININLIKKSIFPDTGWQSFPQQDTSFRTLDTMMRKTPQLPASSAFRLYFHNPS